MDRIEAAFAFPLYRVAETLEEDMKDLANTLATGLHVERPTTVGQKPILAIQITDTVSRTTYTYFYV